MSVSTIERPIVAAPWARVPKRPSPGRWRRLLWRAYVSVFVSALVGPLALEGVRIVFGSVPRGDAGAVVGWVVAGAGLAAISSGLAGGPWWFPAGTAAWVLPSHVGPATIRRATIGLLVTAAGVGAMTGGGLVLALGASDTSPLTRLAFGAGSGAAVAVTVSALAVVVHPRTRVATVAAVGLIALCVVSGVVSWATGGTAPVVASAASGVVPPAGLLWMEVAVAFAAALTAVVVAAGARVERLDARARDLGTLSVILFNQDLRSLLALRARLSGEHPHDRPCGRWALRLRSALSQRPVPCRHFDNLRRSSRRRVARIGLLVGLLTWGWWLVWLRSPILGVATVSLSGWFVALEVAEPLGQELDRPTLAPRSTSRHRLAHIATSAAPATVLLSVPAFVLGVLLGGSDIRRAAIVLGPGVVVTSLAGAAHSLLRPDVKFDIAKMLVPEAYGVSVLVRELRPPALAAIGMAPLISHDRWLRADTAALGAGLRNLLLAFAVLLAVLGVAAWQQRRADRRQAR